MIILKTTDYTVVFILLSLCLTLLLSSVVLFSELLKMSSYHTFILLNSLVCHYSLAAKLDLKNQIMCSCKECVS